MLFIYSFTYLYIHLPIVYFFHVQSFIIYSFINNFYIISFCDIAKFILKLFWENSYPCFFYPFLPSFCLSLFLVYLFIYSFFQSFLSYLFISHLFVNLFIHSFLVSYFMCSLIFLSFLCMNSRS